MIVSVKELNTTMELKNKGMELEIRDTNNEFLGDLVIGKGGITWCKGKTTPKNGIKKAGKKLFPFLAIRIRTDREGN